MAHTSYAAYDKKYNTPHNRPCINGTKTSSSKCVAYCYCDAHPGFLTEKLRKEHQCIEKDCSFYLPKLIKTTPKSSYVTELTKVIEDLNHIKERIMSIAKSETSNLEGLHIKRVVQENDGNWIVYYITISDYDLDAVAQHISEKTGVSVKLSKLDYDFENTARMISSLIR